MTIAVQEQSVLCSEALALLAEIRARLCLNADPQEASRRLLGCIGQLNATPLPFETARQVRVPSSTIAPGEGEQGQSRLAVLREELAKAVTLLANELEAERRGLEPQLASFAQAHQMRRAYCTNPPATR